MYYIKAKNGNDVKRLSFICAICGTVGLKSTQIAVDHIMPVINPTAGFVDFNEYLDRLFCEESNFQVLCTTCHTIKTNAENEIRREDATEEYFKPKKKKG